MTLNPQQLEAVQHKKGPLLILAGAGTGKTRVLTHRIAYLIQHAGVSPGRILAVTFTNKAAGEMKKRLEQLVDTRARELWVGTFHSICLKILRRHALEIGIAPSFVIYDEVDQRSLLKKIFKDFNMDDKKLPPSAVLNRISRLKDQLVSASDWRRQADDPFSKKIADIYEAYEKELAKNNALDFGDLIFKTVLLFEGKAHILKGYQTMWQYILVDEYQDTNHAQYRLIDLLSKVHQNLSVVGDPDQSIYRWRGADIHNILDFEKDYAQTKVIRLEQNYRSVQNVLKAASAVISHNERRKEKGLWSEHEKGEKIIVASLNSEKDEANFVIERLREFHEKKKISFWDMAIFYRTNAQSRALEEILRFAGIPHIIYGGVRFYERAEVKDALAYLKVLVHPQDSVAFKRIINCPARGIGKTTIEKIDGVATSQNLSFFDAAKNVGHPKLKEFLDWFEKIQGHLEEGEDSVEVLKKMLDESGYIRFLNEKGPVEASERLSNVNELLAALSEFETVHEFLDHVALITDLDQTSKGGVLSLMTLHLAKGLEFRAVAIVGLEEGLLPHARSMDEIDELEEERRLFYVGMTRAKEHLVISHAWRRYLNGQEQYSLPSRFLEEIPQELKHRVDFGKRWDPEDDDEELNQDWEEKSVYRVGLKVRHPDFGVGIVHASEKTSLGEKVTVKFANGMIKKLIAEYAHLQKV